MIIDCHNHVLAAGDYPGYKTFIQQMGMGYFRAEGKLPCDRMPAEEDWAGLEYTWEPINPDKLIADHDKAGIDKSVVLAVAPSEYTDYMIRGSLDVARVTDVPGSLSLEKANDYIAAVVRKSPDKLIGFAAVNPKFRGTDWAVKELERAIKVLKLTGLKLYPPYDHYSPDDKELMWPIFAKAEQLDIPVMIHQACTGVVDAPIKYGRPFLLDDVGRAFKNLRVLICHAGVPWYDEALIIAGKHPNFHMDMSYMNSLLTAEEIFDFLRKAKSYGVPFSKICFGSDYPGFEFPETLVPKMRRVFEIAQRQEKPLLSQVDFEGIMGNNFARFIRMPV